MKDEPSIQKQQPKSRRTYWASFGIFLSTIAIVLLVSAFGYGYYELSKVNIELAK
jgi:hypothetical protein